jgi:hypothetical protein
MGKPGMRYTGKVGRAPQRKKTNPPRRVASPDDSGNDDNTASLNSAYRYCASNEQSEDRTVQLQVQRLRTTKDRVTNPKQTAVKEPRNAASKTVATVAVRFESGDLNKVANWQPKCDQSRRECALCDEGGELFQCKFVENGVRCPIHVCLTCLQQNPLFVPVYDKVEWWGCCKSHQLSCVDNGPAVITWNVTPENIISRRMVKLNLGEKQIVIVLQGPMKTTIGLDLLNEIQKSTMNFHDGMILISASFVDTDSLIFEVKDAARIAQEQIAKYGNENVNRVLIVFASHSSADVGGFATKVCGDEFTTRLEHVTPLQLSDIMAPLFAAVSGHECLMMFATCAVTLGSNKGMPKEIAAYFAFRYGITSACFTHGHVLDFNIKLFLMTLTRELMLEGKSVTDSLMDAMRTQTQIMELQETDSSGVSGNIAQVDGTTCRRIAE